MRVETEQPLAPGRWQHVLMTYDGSRVAGGIRVYIDGQPRKLRVHLDDLNQSFENAQPLRIGGGGGPAGRFHGALDDVRIYADCLTPAEALLVATPERPAAILAIPAERRTPGQAAKLRAVYLEHAAPAMLRQAHQDLERLRRARARLIESFPTTMVMEEMPRPRAAFVLVRGEYDKHGEKVSRGVPASLPPFPAGAPSNRLGLARWLVDPANPLTARVAVNRYWEQYFGAGLVPTTEDFGSQGQWPTHPELLDWLATEFVQSGWNVKRLQRLIVTSATYRQSSRTAEGQTPRSRSGLVEDVSSANPRTPRSRSGLVSASSAIRNEKDSTNRLLGRGPRFRLSAEMVRDQALAFSGLLVEHIGGPPVKPYQPKGLWRELADQNYEPDRGEGLYRRSLYTFWKRTVAPPTMVNFDAPLREACVVRTVRTNTPLQALTLMNDVTYVEAARGLAQRILREGGKTPQERLSWAFRLATARKPRPPELQVLADGLRLHLAHYRQDRAGAEQLIHIGESKPDPTLDVGELAAYTAVATLILNLDEVVTRE